MVVKKEKKIGVKITIITSTKNIMLRHFEARVVYSRKSTKFVLRYPKISNAISDEEVLELCEDKIKNNIIRLVRNLVSKNKDYHISDLKNDYAKSFTSISKIYYYNASLTVMKSIYEKLTVHEYLNIVVKNLIEKDHVNENFFRTYSDPQVGVYLIEIVDLILSKLYPDFLKTNQPALNNLILIVMILKKYVDLINTDYLIDWEKHTAEIFDNIELKYSKLAKKFKLKGKGYDLNRNDLESLFTITFRSSPLNLISETYYPEGLN